MFNHTDMQDKYYCGHSNDINPIQSQYKGNPNPATFVLALNRVNVVAVTTILVLHVGEIGYMFRAIGLSCSSPFIPRALARKGVLLPAGDSAGAFASSRGFGDRYARNI